MGDWEMHDKLHKKTPPENITSNALLSKQMYRSE